MECVGSRSLYTMQCCEKEEKRGKIDEKWRCFWEVKWPKSWVISSKPDLKMVKKWPRSSYVSWRVLLRPWQLFDGGWVVIFTSFWRCCSLTRCFEMTQREYSPGLRGCHFWPCFWEVKRPKSWVISSKPDQKTVQKWHLKSGSSFWGFGGVFSQPRIDQIWPKVDEKRA
jgi:hypothetical protein